MPEGGEGQPQPIHKPEAKHVTEARHTIDSAATPRQQPTESKEDLYARAHQRRQRIEKVVQDIEKLAGQSIQASNTLDTVFSPQTPSKEQKKTGIRGLISRLVRRNKSTEPPSTK
jgi:hypothetical protein